MFNLFRAAEKVGSDLIQEAIGQFESIAEKIEAGKAGVRHNREFIAGNEQQIASLQSENKALHTDATRGEAVAAKLRALIS